MPSHRSVSGGGKECIRTPVGESKSGERNLSYFYSWYYGIIEKVLGRRIDSRQHCVTVAYNFQNVRLSNSRVYGFQYTPVI